MENGKTEEEKRTMVINFIQMCKDITIDFFLYN